MRKGFHLEHDLQFELYHTMVRIRRFEEKILQLFKEGRLRGTTHVCIGQEAVAAGACAALSPEDFVTSNHRGHGHMLAKGASMPRLMSELFGKDAGFSKGRGGSQHIAIPEIGFLCSNGITAGGLPLAAGCGLSIKLSKTNKVCLAFFGDGATAQGAFHEAVNLCAVWKLPVIFLCENNQFAMGTRPFETCPTQTIRQRADGYGIQSFSADGNDPFDMFDAVAKARSLCTQGDGPVFIEALTFRIFGHSRSDRADYVQENERSLWEKRDPVRHLRETIKNSLPGGQDLIDQCENDVALEIAESVDEAEKSLASPFSDNLLHLFPSRTTHCQNKNPNIDLSNITFGQALYKAMQTALHDPEVVLLGEDIAEYGGAFKITRDLYCQFGKEKVRNTPISENTIVGAGVGAAMTGLRPIVELMFMDFALLALDQLVNHAAKFYYVFGGSCKVPLTVRMPSGGYRGYGATHSQCFESLLIAIPGLKVFCPATVRDAHDLLLEAIYDDAPVAFVEHKLLYATRAFPDIESLPQGVARIMRTGTDLTIVTYSFGLHLSLDAAEVLAQEGINAEVIDLRTLNPLDMETVVKSVTRTQRACIVEEGPRTGGIGGELTAQIQEQCFGYLDAPVKRVAALDFPIPAAEHLEKAVLPQVADIVASARSIMDEI